MGTQWEKPDDYVEDEFSSSPKAGAAEDDAAAASSSKAPAAAASGLWEKYTDDEGREYYYNKTTGTSQWENPDEDYVEDKWKKHYTNDEGFEYYYNATSGESTWDKPDGYVDQDDTTGSTKKMELTKKLHNKSKKTPDYYHLSSSWALPEDYVLFAIEVTMKETCTHGGRPQKSLLDVFDRRVKDLIRYLKLLDGGSKKEKEEIMERFRSTHKAMEDKEDNNKSIMLKEVYSICAQAILDGEIEMARTLCFYAIWYEGQIYEFLGGNDALDVLAVSVKSMQEITNIKTDQQLLVHVSKRIPCNCVRRKRKEMGLREATAKCALCRVEKPVEEMFLCSLCNAEAYCSENCFNPDWKQHEEQCYLVCRKKATQFRKWLEI